MVTMAEDTPIIYERTPEIDLLRILKFLTDYRWFILIFTCSCAVLAFLFFFITGRMAPEKSPLPNLYRPVAVLLINDKGSSNLLSSLQGSSAFSGASGLAASFSTSFSYGELAIQLLRSKTILDLVAEEFSLRQRYGITANPIGRTRGEIIRHMYTNYNEKTMLMAIGYEDYDPQFASQVVDRLVTLLDKRFLSIGGNKNITQKKLLENNLIEVKAQISSLEEDIREFQNKYGVLDIESLAMEQVTMMARFRSQLILTEMEIKTYTSFSTIEDPVSKRLQAERDSLYNLIQDMESGYSDYYNVLPNQQELSNLARQFYHMQRDLNVQEKIYEILTQQYELIKLSLEHTEPVFQVIEVADVPDLKIAPGRTFLTILTAIGAGFLSIALAFLHYLYQKNRLHHTLQPAEPAGGAPDAS